LKQAASGKPNHGVAKQSHGEEEEIITNNETRKGKLSTILLGDVGGTNIRLILKQVDLHDKE
jgi:hypothetical protein